MYEIYICVISKLFYCKTASSKVFLTTFAASIAAELAEAKIDVLAIVSKMPF
jgi:short-subunit dehydrogenase